MDSNRSKLNDKSKRSENHDPNVASPGMKCTKSPLISSGESAKKSVSRNPKPSQVVVVSSSASAKKKIQDRKFVVVGKKKSRGNEELDCCQKCKKANGKSNKCLCVAYESLRASQDEFFRNRGGSSGFDRLGECEDGVREGIKVNQMDPNKDEIFASHGSVRVCQDEFFKSHGGIGDEVDNDKLGDRRKVNRMDQNGVVSEGNVEGNDGELGLKRSRDRLLEAVRECAPEPGSGRVMHLVKAFENLQLSKKSGDSEEKGEGKVDDDNKGIKWALPGLQSPEVSNTQVSSSSFCPSDFLLTSESLGLDSRCSYSLDSSQGSISTRTSAGGRKSRRSSLESSGTINRRLWKMKQCKVTSQKPFMLKTEQRGRCKEEEFMKKLQQTMEEEEKLRVRIAQGLPWTTDEPECLVKPPVKEKTRSLDLVLHTDTRAVDRAEFDNQVAKKMDLIEQYRTEKERQQKLEEEEEIRRLRKELVPKAQPMPYFDRPFIPTRRRSRRVQLVSMKMKNPGHCEFR